ncbi:MAG: hypothetical protein LBL59_02720 [Xanthomonadaceae bacterium]|jgi:hypothetical protein|nr:hypothetical protein [Xanthomonadaceae bacterium]
MGDERQRDADHQALPQQPAFLNLPEGLRSFLLASPRAGASVSALLERDGLLVIDADEPLAAYYGHVPPRLHISAELAGFAAGVQTYATRRLGSAMICELGRVRFNPGSYLFPEKGNVDQYLHYRARLEAMAIESAFPAFVELSMTLPGFIPDWDALEQLTGLALEPVFSQWRSDGDTDAAVATLAEQVLELPYGNQAAADEDERSLKRHDLYRRDYTYTRGGFQDAGTPATQTDLSRLAHYDAPPPGHPDYAMYQQALAGVHQLDLEHNRIPDEYSERLAINLTMLAKQNGFSRIDHVMLSGRGNHAKYAENVFVVQGNLDEPSHERAFMKTVMGVRSDRPKQPCRKAGAAAPDPADPAGGSVQE